jgi:dihydrofolate reductase
MLVSCIVATAKNGVIGHHNQIPWYLPADLKYFKKITQHHHIVMGRKCFESIGNPLPNRTNIVITRSPYYVVTGCLVVHSVAEALQIAEDNDEKEVFIIGGGEIYSQSVEFWDRIYWTEVDIEPEGDVFFPNLDLSEWQLTSNDCFDKDEKNEHAYCFKVYDRK